MEKFHSGILLMSKDLISIFVQSDRANFIIVLEPFYTQCFQRERSHPDTRPNTENNVKYVEL